MTGTAPEPWASRSEHDWYARQYWQMRARRDGGRAPLTTSQHILHLLLTVLTLGLWAPVWIIRAIQGNRTPPDPSAPVPEWPPPGKVQP